MESPENIVRYLTEAINGSIVPVVEETIDIPPALFSTFESHVENDHRELNFENVDSSTLPYEECLRRVVRTWPFDEAFNILVGTEETDSGNEYSLTRKLLELFKDDLLKYIEALPANVEVVPVRNFRVKEKFVLASSATLPDLVAVEGDTITFEEQLVFTDQNEWQVIRSQESISIQLSIR